MKTEEIQKARTVVKNDEVAMFASEDDLLIYEHFYLTGVAAERERIKKLFDTKLLPIDPIPMNILKIAKAVSEIYDKIKL